jgi:hypothetical protein
MNKFENMINNGKFASDTINCIIFDLNNNTTFDATINAKTINEIDSILPEGFELDTEATLCNYFDNKLVNEFRIELLNSQYIYFTNFKILLQNGFNKYIKALQKEQYNITNYMDRQVYK